jgi:hypothetical protein
VPIATLPALDFSVEEAAPLERAAAPSIRFGVRVEAEGGEAIRSILLHTQVQIAARRRAYTGAAEVRLFELFGAPESWGTNLRTLLWTRHTQVVPAFTGSVLIDVVVPCTYDFEVAASRYLAALDGGDVPLELLFSGTVFYSGDAGQLQTGQISWDREAEYRMPVSVWRETMEQYFPGTAWLRLRRDNFEKLQAYKSKGAFTSFDDAIESLL